MALQKPSNRSKSALAAATTANISILKNSGFPQNRAVAAGITITKKLVPKRNKKK